MEELLTLIDRQIEIKREEIPSQYCWSGYTQSANEFEEKNFCRTYLDNHKVLICAAENVVALCEYLSKEILRLDFVHDMENIFSPGYNIWFSLRWEQALAYLEEFPLWIQDIIEILIREGIVNKVSVVDEDFYYLLDSDYYFDNPLPQNIVDAIEQRCKISAINYWKDLLSGYDYLCEMPEPECGKWGMNLFGQFKMQYADIEVSAGCGPDDGPSAGCGTTFAYDQWPSDDTSWIYEGISDSMSENWEDFEDIAKKADNKCREHYLSKKIIPKSEEEVEDLSLQIIADIMGPCRIEYEINGEPADLTNLVNDEDVSLAMYQWINDNFAVSYGVYIDLKK